MTIAAEQQCDNNAANLIQAAAGQQSFLGNVLMESFQSGVLLASSSDCHGAMNEALGIAGILMM